MISNFKKFFKNLKSLGLKNAFYSILSFFLKKIKKPSIKIEKKKYIVLSDWIYKKFGECFESINADDTSKSIPENIFVFWWQGYQNAPELVQRCIDSIKKNCDSYNVYIIDKYNFNTFVKIEQRVIELLNSGKISPTFFSDILRFNLLDQIGGVWIDATCFLTSKLDKKIFNKSFFSLKGSFDIRPRTDFFMGSSKNNTISHSICKFFNSYIKKFDYHCTYLLMDTAMLTCYRYNVHCKKQIDSIETNSKAIFELNDMLLDLPFENKVYLDLCSKTYIHKLSYKFSHSEVTKNNNLTFYGALLKKII